MKLPRLLNRVLVFTLVLSTAAPIVTPIPQAMARGDSSGEKPQPAPTPAPGANRPKPNPTQSPRPRPTPTSEPTHSPRPTPTSEPTHSPRPTPTTEPTSIPTSVPTTPAPDTAAARNAGRFDGEPDGSREGRERGQNEGRDDGDKEGYREGYGRCESEERDRQYGIGYGEGYDLGRYEGTKAGSDRGEIEGADRGRREGQADGETRADRDAYVAATPPGRDEGNRQADASDAGTRGQHDGEIAGDQQAKQKALSDDYPRGHQEYRAQRYAEPVQSQDEILQKAVPSEPVSSQSQFQPSQVNGFNEPGPFSDRMGRGRGASPDFRYSHPQRNYPTPEENAAYQQGYRTGYTSGFGDAYGQAYNRGYGETHDRALDRGCRDGRNQNFDRDRQRGYDAGRGKGYDDYYETARGAADSAAYGREFGPASEAAYRANYEGDYDRHYENARSTAYQARYGEIYNSAFTPAKEAKFAELYPTYAQRENERGKADEAEDFRQRPLRIEAAIASETIVNGIYEPNESLRVRLSVRNFADYALKGGDVSLRIQSTDPSSSVITEASSNLIRDIKPKSVTDIREALEFRVNESSVGRTLQFSVTVLYQGRAMGTQLITVNPSFMTRVEFAENPQLKEGLSMPLKVRVTNLSQKATDAGLKVKLATDTKLLQLMQPELTVGVLNPGESRIVTFTGIARTSQAVQAIPLALLASTGGGRRVGVLDMTGQVPIVNDYRVVLTTQPAGLRQAGVIRLLYTVRNVSSRLIMHGLQLKVRFSGVADDSNFVVIGPNPQFLMPMDQGETVQFVVPVLVRQSNPGGIVELELQEDGAPVVIHQAGFNTN